MKGMNGIIAGNEPLVLNYAERNQKFRQEKVCWETERYLVQFDGILLSHAKPQTDTERFELLAGLYERFGSSMTAHLKGQYNLVIWDKMDQKVLVANDLLSKRSMYYCIHGQKLLYAASYCDLLDLLSRCGGFQPRLNAEAVQMMTRSGSLAGNATYVAEVQYLDAYQAVEYDLGSGSASVVSIVPENSYAASGMDEAIRIFDQLFTNAVQAQFQKNAEYGYEHFFALSGGMDSRACLLKAVQCGYRQGITCVNYSQSGSIDNTVSQQIAFDHDLDYLFYPMDAAVFMNRLSDALDRNECQQSSIGSTGAGTMARLLDKTAMGVMHVGLCGGELMGDLVTCTQTSRLQHAMRMLGISISSGGEYLFNLRNYLDNVRACQNFSHMFLADCETVSPFLDEDVVQFVTGLQPQLLYRRNLYREWMKKHIPNDYTTTMFCGPITISPAKELLRKIADQVIRRFAGTSKRDMNPIGYWLKTHPHLAQACAEEYRSGLELLQQSGVSDEILSILRDAWLPDGVKQLYTLTALTAVKDVLARFETIR